jgi:hypothetical protein
MAKSLITGGPSHGALGLIEISDKIARLSEAEYAFETKRRKLEHQFEDGSNALMQSRQMPGHFRVRPAGAPSHDACWAACAADVTRARRRSPLGL